MRRGLAGSLALVVPVLFLGASPCGAQVKYPVTKKIDHVDTYHGVQVPDPYRWLEDDNSAETAAWVKAENEVTFAYLDRIPFRRALRQRIEQLYDYPKYSAPSRRGEFFFFSKNEGLQPQSVIYRQKGLAGTPELVLDPNTWSKDGTTPLSVFSLSRDGKYAVYGMSVGGSDWSEYHVMEVATRQALPDLIKWVKVSGAAWAGNGFFYSRYPAPEKGHELSAKNENHQVFFHRLGTPQEADELVYQDPANPQRFHTVEVTEDERFAILTISDRGTGKNGNSLFYRDLASADRTFKPIVAEITDDEFTLVDNVGEKFLVQTNRKAPNGRVFLFDPAAPGEASWKDVLPERPEPLQGAGTGGGRLFATYMKDVTTRAYVYALDGSGPREVALPGVGAASGFGGLRDDTSIFYTYTSFNHPPTIFRYEIATGRSTPFREPVVPDFKAGDYEVKQVFYTSKDGTRVPMFLTYKKGLVLNGANPTLLYGYGGFNIAMTPGFSALRIPLLENGFVYASANLRGGSEYGEKWHEAGTKLNKQNVFDDFIAAAEWLVANKYTSAAHLAIQGGSNGGLLVGAVMNQRPELFKVAIPQVGVMDMLRFNKFTIGWNWIPDYGSSDDAAEFKALYGYSPLHNIKAGTKYPATFITTADHDDRVVPAHSFKYAATLQERQGGDAPVLIRVETMSSHGASNVPKALDTQADVYAFLFQNLGVTPRF